MRPAKGPLGDVELPAGRGHAECLCCHLSSEYTVISCATSLSPGYTEEPRLLSGTGGSPSCPLPPLPWSPLWSEDML